MNQQQQQISDLQDEVKVLQAETKMIISHIHSISKQTSKMFDLQAEQNVCNLQIISDMKKMYTKSSLALAYKVVAIVLVLGILAAIVVPIYLHSSH